MFTAKNTTTSSPSPSSITNKGTNAFIQPKLNIGKSGDKYEIEADKAADQIVAKSNESSTPFFPATPAIQKQSEEDVQKQDTAETEIQQKPVVDPITPGVQLKESTIAQKAEEEEIQQQEESSQEGEELQMVASEDTLQQTSEDTLQTKESSDITPPLSTIQKMAQEDVQRMEDEEIQEKEEEEVQTLQKQTTGDEANTSSIENDLNNSKGGGSPLDTDTKSEMESGFGADFGGVRVHNDANAVQMNQQLGSQAFANGNDIYFNEGKYNPESDTGKHLLAHELTHTVQQGASDTKSVQKAEEGTVAPTTKPTTALDISQRLSLTDEWAAYLDSESSKGKRTFDIDVKIGGSYRGTIKVNKTNRTAEGKAAKYELAKGNDRYLEISGWSFLNPLRQAGVTPILVLKSFGDEQQTTGFLSVKMGDKALVGDVQGFIKGLNENLEKMQFLGIAPINVTDGLENTFENGRLVFQISALSTVVDGFLEAGGGLGITGETFTFNLNANVDVAGLASGEFTIARAEDGKLSGTGQIQADIANVQATINVEYIEGVVTIQGTGKMNSEKFSGEITLLVTDEAKSKQMMHAALGTEALDKEKENAAKPAGPVTKAKGNQVLAGWGEIKATITPWLEGTAKVGIDSKGQVTIVGEVVVPNEVELMEQRGKKVDLFNVEIRAGYGIPLVGQVFLFASVGMFVNAGFGPLVLKDVGFTGTYSTDPDVLQNFSITGTLGINAFAIIGLEAEAGVGVTLLGHDLKAGVNVTAAAGLRAYAEATPTFEYQESKAPEGGKIGESRLKGHFEAAAQLFLQLTGSLFYELDSPWWSPAPDGREDFPLGEVQYPIGDSMGIGADLDWLVGSPDAPELTFSPVDFDPDKFTADVMADPPPKKMGKADQEKQGDWKPEGGDGKEKDPKVTGNGKGLPENNKKKEDLKKLPDEQKYMRALDEMSKLEKANPKPVLSVVDAKAKRVKKKYGLRKIELRNKKDDSVSVYVQHGKEDNGKHLLKVPLMSMAEAIKLRSDAMTDLRAQEKKVAGEAGTIDESAAKEMIKVWLKAHPIVENANVVDGKETWDYFIDFGDKSNTEKGKVKKGETNDKNKIPGEGDGEVGKVVKFTDGEEKHTLWVDITSGVGVLKIASDPDTVASKIKKWEDELKTDPWKSNKRAKKKITIEGHIADIKTKLKVIEDNLSETSASTTITEVSETVPSNPLGITARADNAIEKKEDSMLKPLKELFKLFGEKFDFRVLFEEDFTNTHEAAKEDLLKGADEMTEIIEDKKEIQSWDKLLNWIKTTDSAGEIFDNPVKNQKDYGKHIVSLIMRIGKATLTDIEEDKKEDVINTKIDILTKSKNIATYKAIVRQITNKNLEADTNDSIKKYLAGEESVSADLVFREIKTAVKEEVNKDKYINTVRDGSDWIAVFPSKGKKTYKVDTAIPEPENMLDLLGGIENVKTPLMNALQIAIKESDGVDENDEQILKLAKETASRIMAQFKRSNLFYIESTPIVRYLTGAKDANSVIRNNSEYKGGFSAIYNKKAGDYANQEYNNLESQLEGQIHHLVPLYLGGSHNFRNLIPAVGSARVKTQDEAKKSAHNALHKLIESKNNVKLRIKDTLEENQIFETVTLQSLSPGHLASGFKDKTLNLIIGTMFSDGFVDYFDTEIKIEDIKKDE